MLATGVKSNCKSSLTYNKSKLKKTRVQISIYKICHYIDSFLGGNQRQVSGVNRPTIANRNKTRSFLWFIEMREHSYKR